MKQIVVLLSILMVALPVVCWGEDEAPESGTDAEAPDG